MKTTFIPLIIFLFSSLSYAQISIFEEKSNATSEIIKIPDGMTYDEFLKIQKHIDWSKIMIASVVPGFIHFYANENQKGFIVLGIRVLGYGLMSYAAVDQYLLLNNDNNFSNISSKQERINRNALFFTIGAILNFTGFFYDWADGSLSIEEERNLIYFKYGINESKKIKLGLSFDSIRNTSMINLSLNLD